MAPIITWTSRLLATQFVYSYSSDNMVHVVEYDTSIYKTNIGATLKSQLTVQEFGVFVGARVAINGGFHAFGTDQDTSITKLMVDGQLIVPINDEKILKDYDLTLENINSVLSMTENKVSIGNQEGTSYIYSGPRLLNEGQTTELQSKSNFVKNPRTVVCTSGTNVKFVIIDGRQDTVPGMTLIETQSLLLDIGCVNAINLDGGGSTTLYIEGLGVVNTPRSADKTGGFVTTERRVSNIIYMQ